MHRVRNALRFLASHWIFSAAFAAGLALRIVAMLGFRPAIFLGGDSTSYLTTGLSLIPGISRQSGYGLVLFLLRPAHSFVLVTAVQHAAGLAIAVAIYALLRRYGLPAWGATLAALPVLLDAYQIQLEQEILATTTFGFLVIAAVFLLLWWRDDRPAWATAAAAAALAFSSVTWPAGLPLLVLFVGYLIFRRAGWRAVVTGLVAGALPLVMYLAWFDVNYHTAAFNESDGIFLWSRTMAFANCAVIRPPADESALCPRQPPAQRPDGPTYIWAVNSPLKALPGPKFSPGNNALAMNFALRAIAAQPADYARTVADGFWLTFSWGRPDSRSALHSEKYQFAFATRTWASAATGRELAADQRYYTGAATPTRAVPPLAGWLASYQRFGFLRGSLLGVVLLIGLGGIVARLAGGGFRRRRDWGGPALYPWTAAMVMLIIPNVTASFSIRYVVPAQPVACLAAGLAFARSRRTAALAPGTATAAGPAAAGEPAPAPAAGIRRGTRPNRARLTRPPGRFRRFRDWSAPVSSRLALESENHDRNWLPAPAALPLRDNDRTSATSTLRPASSCSALRPGASTGWTPTS